ncbi:biogenesis regulatory protein homolog [Seminavis robusta]|uniref:Ribosome biogenesis regulatory protein n=1 Tax=Seminavis robusta TaxID=568900 RepID=A0A9N8DLL9_9STRA|nr:biogenesis regulatory protein homolog [Seminavis robusta]|eukprot:Sro147_g067750.1 biogenesis regulatory protein homolog (491) ;mRNA; r:30864-32336
MGSKKKKSSKKKQHSAPKEEKEDQVDYGATVDAFFPGDDSSAHAEEEDVPVEKGDDDDNDKQGDEGTDEIEDDKKNDEPSDDDEEEEDDDESLEEEEEKTANQTASSLVMMDSEEPCSFDLRNLTAVNSHPLHHESLYKNKNDSESASKKKKKKKQQEIPAEDEKLTINNAAQVLNEEYLLQKATEGCTQLIHALWQLPTERSDAGPMVHLPTYDKIPIPRVLPPPPPKAETKWEKFAKERGIPLNKEKRSRKVWDEATDTWKFRHGYDKANAKDNNWPIMEVGGTDDPYEDPWQKQRDAKFARTEDNRQNQMKNQERAGVLPKGAARKVLKSRTESRKAGREGGGNAGLPVGVPVDMTENKLRGQASTLAALKATQKSTASMGRFDKPVEGEPERKFPVSKKKRKYMAESSTGKTSGKGEQERAAKVLQTVLHGGGVETEKARKKGKLAKGVTAYDYEYDDGSNKALFQKKKGRGGIGKNKKMTKKRIK